MKEEFKEWLLNNYKSECWYGASDEKWSQIIDEFFDSYQPERSKREDSSKEEMRCSEHYGDIVREVQ